MKTILGFVIVSYVSVAALVIYLELHARSAANQACENIAYAVSIEGCLNEGVRDNLETSIAALYNSGLRSDTNGDGSITNADIPAISFRTGCISVTNSSGVSLFNDTAHTYLNHVQKGEPIVTSLTVNIEYTMPFSAFNNTGWRPSYTRAFTVTNTAISSKWFKGDAP